MTKNPSKAYAATQVLELMVPGSAAEIAVKKYVASVGGLHSEPTSDPQTELVGLDECLGCLSKVHPHPGKGGGIRQDILDRLKIKQSKDKPADQKVS